MQDVQRVEQGIAELPPDLPGTNAVWVHPGL